MAFMQHEYKELLDRSEFKKQMNPKTMEVVVLVTYDWLQGEKKNKNVPL